MLVTLGWLFETFFSRLSESFLGRWGLKTVIRTHSIFLDGCIHFWTKKMLCEMVLLSSQCLIPSVCTRCVASQLKCPKATNNCLEKTPNKPNSISNVVFGKAVKEYWKRLLKEKNNSDNLRKILEKNQLGYFFSIRCVPLKNHPLLVQLT